MARPRAGGRLVPRLLRLRTAQRHPPRRLRQEARPEDHLQQVRFSVLMICEALKARAVHRLGGQALILKRLT